MKKTMYTLLDDVIIRTPSLALDETTIDFSSDDVSKVFPKVKNALYLSSKVLFEQISKFDSLSDSERKQIELSLYKYYSRMSTRPTPFGLLAGLYSAKWGENKSFKVNKNFKTIVSFDNIVLNRMYSELITSVDVLETLIVYKNDSYQYRDDRFCIIKKHLTKNSKSEYSLKEFSAKKDEALREILDFIEKGKSYKDVSSFIMQSGHDENQSKQFLNLLIQEGILTTSIDPIPNSFLYAKLLLEFSKGNGSDASKKVESLCSSVMEINDKGWVDSSSLSKLENEIKQMFPVLNNEKNLLKVDLNGLENNGYGESLPNTYKNNLHDAYEALKKVGYTGGNSNLELFKTKFTKKYEDKFVPILDVFDQDVGIKYIGNIKLVDTPLIDGIKPTLDYVSNYSLSNPDKLLLNYFYEAILGNKSEIELNLKVFPDSEGDDFVFQDSFYAMFSVISDKSIFINHFGGSASSLISRFNDNKNIKAIQDAITSIEDNIHDGKIVAEIVHLSDDTRMVNVMNNANIRAYNIPIVTNQQFYKDKELVYLKDILMTVRHNKIIFFSKKHNKRIIPKITSAVNTKAVSNLSIYKFLTDVSIEQSGNMKFTWPSVLSTLKPKFIPRVRYRNVILSPSIWLLYRQDFIFTDGIEVYKKKLKDIREARNIPQFVLLRKGDNKLFLNLDNHSISFDLLKKEFNKNVKIEIEEYLYDVNCQNDNEILSFFSVNKNEDVSTVYNKNLEIDFQTSFEPIGEWVNYQIYSSENHIEKILASDKFKTYIEAILEKGVKKWFFVRYVDEDGFHLRIRFQTDKNYDSIEKIIRLTSELLNSERISDYKLVPYKRETNRYKNNIILQSEELFFHHSNLVIRLLQLIKIKKDESLRWLLAVKLFDVLLNQFELTIQEKVSIADRLKNSFNQEFNTNKLMTKDFNLKYKDYKASIIAIIDNDELDQEILKAISKYEQISVNVINDIDKQLSNEEIYDISKSYIHMIFNKLFVIFPRHHELYVYNLIAKYYKMRLYSKN